MFLKISHLSDLLSLKFKIYLKHQCWQVKKYRSFVDSDKNYSELLNLDLLGFKCIYAIPVFWWWCLSKGSNPFKVNIV